MAFGIEVAEIYQVCDRLAVIVGIDNRHVNEDRQGVMTTNKVCDTRRWVIRKATYLATGTSVQDRGSIPLSSTIVIATVSTINMDTVAIFLSNKMLLFK